MDHHKRLLAPLCFRSPKMVLEVSELATHCLEACTSLSARQMLKSALWPCPLAAQSPILSCLRLAPGRSCAIEGQLLVRSMSAELRYSAVGTGQWICPRRLLVCKWI